MEDKPYITESKPEHNNIPLYAAIGAGVGALPLYKIKGMQNKRALAGGIVGGYVGSQVNAYERKILDNQYGGTYMSNDKTAGFMSKKIIGFDNIPSKVAAINVASYRREQFRQEMSKEAGLFSGFAKGTFGAARAGVQRGHNLAIAGSAVAGAGIGAATSDPGNGVSGAVVGGIAGGLGGRMFRKEIVKGFTAMKGFSAAKGGSSNLPVASISNRGFKGSDSGAFKGNTYNV